VFWFGDPINELGLPAQCEIESLIASVTSDYFALFGGGKSPTSGRSK
jgi:hypothetical protein